MQWFRNDFSPETKKVNKSFEKRNIFIWFVITDSLAYLWLLCGIPLICQDLDLDKIFSRLVIVKSQETVRTAS